MLLNVDYNMRNVTSSSYSDCEIEEIIEHEFLLSASCGDQIDIYDEERDWWQSGTIIDIHPFDNEITFKFDDNFDENSNHSITNYKWRCKTDDFEFDEGGTYTLNEKSLSFPKNRYVCNDQIMSFIDNDGDEHIGFATKPMSNNDNDTIKKVPTEIMIYNINRDVIDRNYNSPNCIVQDLPQNIFNAHNWTNRIECALPFSFNINRVENVYDIEHEHECGDMNKVYIPKLNELHILSHDLCNSYTYHFRYNLHSMTVSLLEGFNGCNDMIYDGKLIYISATNSLMYFGGDDNDNYCSRNIWFYDLNNIETAKWCLYSVKLPENDNTFNVISGGELIFLFYNNSRSIYIYDLVKIKVHRISKQYPAPFEGKAVSIKTSDNFIHFMNGTKLTKDLKVRIKPYHFKINLDELVPDDISKSLKKRYNLLISRYLYIYIEPGYRFNHQMSRFLTKQIEAYFPMFL